MSVQYEIFESAKLNNLKRVKELLDAGVDVNLVDFDNGSTPLHYACSNGGKQTIEFLVDRGATVNAQNERGITPLHMLITKRYDVIALW
jgi:ankyrin repeat protein